MQFWLAAMEVRVPGWKGSWGALLGALALTAAPAVLARQGLRAVLVKPGTQQPGIQEARVALVIGNGAYPDAPLRNPVHDARAMQTALEACGFQVTLLADASKRDMENAIRDFGDRIRNGAVGLFYFAGHGIQVKGINYLVPVGANLEREDEVVYQAVEAGQVLDKMDTAKNRLNIMILDACRNNPFSRNWRGGGDRGLAQVNAPTGSFIAFATAPGREAADGKGEHGLYTEALLAQLDEPGMELEKVFKRTREKVMAASQGQQTPWESNSTVGDFYFTPAAQPGPGAAPARASVPASAPSVPGPVPVPGAPAAPVPGPVVVPGAGPGEEALEAKGWAAIENSRNAGDFEAFLARFPRGAHALLANVKRKNLRMPAAAEAGSLATAPWQALQRVQLETREEYAVRIAALGPVAVGRAVVSVDNYDVDTHQLVLPIQAEPWAKPYGLKDFVVIDLDRDRMRKLLAAGGSPTVTLRFGVKEGRLEPGALAIETALGSFTPGLPGSQAPVIAVAPVPPPATAAPVRPVPRLPAPKGAGAAPQGPWQNRFGMTFAGIPAGSFTMGDNAGGADEKPARTVRITRPFAMQTTHVTVRQWRAFAEATHYVTYAEAGGTVMVFEDHWGYHWTEQTGLSWRDPGFKQQDDHPVVGIAWADAQAFIHWLNQEDPGKGYRLPTEAEWEYACKAGTQGPRYGDLDRIAWYWSQPRTHPVAGKEPNAWGLYDMLGNALQWCQDWYGMTSYASSGEADPQGPPTGQSRVLRGGGWHLSAAHVRSSFRNMEDRYLTLTDTGFRVVMTAP